ncbi:MAG: GNAT family N-acetyltransferase [Anaerolineae bacterium]|nr:GNAT family N-acetyltransferase [Anaerolineae bacterium]
MTPLPLALHAPNPKIPFRPVRLTDSDSLYADCWPGRSFASVYNLVQRAARSQLDGRGLGLVIPGEPNRVLGYGQVLMWPSCAEISDMVVVEPYRGRGLGTAMIQTLIQQAIKMGAEEAEIGAAQNNPRAAALYRRLGFEDSHTVLLNLGKGKEHVLFLRLKLRPSRYSRPS